MLVLLAAGVAVPAAASGEPADEPITLLVRWADDVGADARGTVTEQAREATGGGWQRQPLTDRVDTLEVAADDASAVADALRAHVEVELVERDRVIELPARGARASDRGDAATAEQTVTDPAAPLVGPRTASDDDATTSPEEPSADYFDLQWGLENRGDELGPFEDGSEEGRLVQTREGVDVRARLAWEQSLGDPEVVVGVIDTPVDVDHPDLSGSIVDEIDLIDGASGRSHGTQVVSVIAAGGEQGGTMLGLAPEVGVLNIAAFTEPEDDEELTPGGESSTETLVKAFDEAEQAEVDVINASWVGELRPGDSQLLESTIAELDIPVVAASGNEGWDLTDTDVLLTPVGLDLPNLISVTAIDAMGELPDFANTGRGVVDVAAPGADVLVALPGGEDFGIADGTSFAAPFVSAAIALGREAEPTATTGELIDAVRWTSRFEASLKDTTTAGGMLDAATLVRGVPRPVCGGEQESAGFDDLDGSVHVASIDCIAQLGVTSGKADGTYDPRGTVTRAQMAGFLANIIERAVPELPEPEPAGFTDVDEDHVHAEAIDLLFALGIVEGDEEGRFRPSRAVTRGQLASFLVRTHDELIAGSGDASRTWFDDTEGTTHADAIHRARDLGLVKGVASVAYDPGSSTRRDQMASLLARTVDALARLEVEVQ